MRKPLLLALLLLVPALPAAADTDALSADERLHVLADPRTGVALFGYDAVAYHAERRARLGSPRHEAALDGRIWRFASEANKAAFLQDPGVYVPLFGGHDGAAVAEGIMAEGAPELFAIAGGRLALFRDEAGRARFAADAALRMKAMRDWPEVVRQRAGH